MNTNSTSTLTGIPTTELETMVETYHVYAAKHPDYDKSTHVKCVWFSYDRVEAIYNQLKAEKADGLRIYLGRYPADVSTFVAPKPTPNTNSVVLVSTSVSANGAAQTDYFTNTANTAELSDIELMMPPQDRGQQCQPICQGVTIDAGN